MKRDVCCRNDRASSSGTNQDGEEAMRIRTTSRRTTDCDVGLAIFGASGHAIASHGNERPALPQEPGYARGAGAAASAQALWEGVRAPATQDLQEDAALLQ
jgi:hypothetical protein